MIIGWGLPFCLSDIAMVLDVLVLICLHGDDVVLVLAGNTRIYSHGRLWLPIHRAGGMNSSHQDIFLLVGLFGLFRGFSSSILLVQLAVLFAFPEGLNSCNL